MPRSERRPVGRPRKSPRVPDRPVDEDIVAVATRLFARRGVTGTTMSAIAEAAGLGVSSLYYWFSSKEDILERIVTDSNAVPLRQVLAVQAEGGESAVRLYRVIRRDAAALCRLPFDINEIHRMAAEDTDGTFVRYWADRQRLNDEVEAIVVEGMADGSLMQGDARLATLTLMSNGEGAQNWVRPRGGQQLRTRDHDAGGPYTPEEAATFLADLALRGLLTAPARLDVVRAAADALDQAEDARHNET